VRWVSRVPSTLAEVKQVLAVLSTEQFAIVQPGNWVAEWCSVYGEIHCPLGSS